MAKSIMVRVPPAAYEQVAKIIAQVRQQEAQARLEEAITAHAQKREKAATSKKSK